ncbi:hypothetical protein [Frondihabitans australicus]|uniref:Uncharacterized protein n=1 Tax=Frondihabitans australicus TaxID=386892 RepID=A0A495IDP3_9MICO|nr:hypothetical protein [Frondihabitans australicus]RKR73245.1 hypothetical protein C8E83_0335 [Frondihabitans australicus]
MSRRTTAIWIAAAVVVAGAGIGVAAVAAAHPRAVTASAGHTARPTTVGSTPSAPPSAPATSAAPSPSTPSAPSAPATTGSGADQGAGSGSGTGQTVSKKKVTPDLSYYSFSGQTLTLGGGVSGLVENGGTCTVTVKNATATVTQAFPASAGPSSTDCGAMAITSPKLAHGSWTITIAYSSADAAGTSGESAVTL